ncbi:MAG: ribonuclease R [Bdellovibrionaceae bacterium]|nr:ribonuclease R [Pseudobdellovibrionaceae bacterium]
MKKNIKSSVIGFVKRHPDGFGFLIPLDIEFPDVYIPRKSMVGVMTNDKVEVEVRPEPDGERYRGRVIKVIQRGITQVIGRFHPTSEDEGMLLDHSHGWGTDLHVYVPSQTPVKDGDLVSVKIITYPDSEDGFSGKIVKVLGDALDPNTDNMRILFIHEIPYDFSKECINQAESFSEEVEESDFKDREDLRKDMFVTIDGATARDFDDAILVSTTDKGFRLKVAIADVSHYVKPGDPIDQDAYIRGTSTYFPGFVAPMLPEKLSNHLCSLKPNVPRLSLVADMYLDFQGELLSTKIYEAVIESKARVTYGEAQEVVDGNTPDKLKHVESYILKAADLAKILMAKRFKEGSLNLEIPETEVEIDEVGYPIDIIKSERLYSHKIIEEMMLMANVAVARFLRNKEVETLNRIHESPDPEDIKKLELYMHNFGKDKNLLSGGKLQKKITKALQQFKNQPQEYILNVLTLRSMSQAQYSPLNIGHFGLGFEDYVHFTSPIRRYPDLIVHRQLKSIVCPKKAYHQAAVVDLTTAGSFLSACEQRSVKAERQLVSIKKARFMEKFVGSEFEGIISSVTKFGVFVLLRQYDVDGLIRLESLGNDYFEFDEENLCLVGKKTGKTYHLGDSLKVLVSQVDSQDGRIDFVLSEEGRYIPPTPRNEDNKFGRSRKKSFQKETRDKTEKSIKTGISLKTNRRGLRKTRLSKSSRKGKAR